MHPSSSEAVERDYSHPHNYVQQLTACDWKILHELAWLTRIRKRNHPGKRAYVMPRQSYLAAKAGVTREYISRRTRQLARLGFIQKIWRRPVRGSWQTCLYVLGDSANWLISRVINTMSTAVRRVMYTAQKQQLPQKLSHFFKRNPRAGPPAGPP